MAPSETKILCVDDNPDLLLINSSMLRLAGHEVLEASTGEDCLRIAREEHPDLILLDIILPGISGIDVCRQIKANPELSGTYVILITGQETSPGSQIKGLEQGADGYIVRPISGQELLARVQAMIRLKQSETALRKAKEELEIKVAERTAELRKELDERRRVEKALEEYNERLHILSKRLLEIQEAERRYIAKELHDEIGQFLTGLKLFLENITSSSQENLDAKISEVNVLIREILTRVRNMSLDLRPSMLDDFGLLPALFWHFDRYTSLTNVKVNFIHNGIDRRFSPEIETAAYRIVQEALTNVARHAHTDNVQVTIVASSEMIITVEDHGVGFEFRSARNSPGLSGMDERLALLGGHLTIDSVAGKGTQITAAIPL